MSSAAFSMPSDHGRRISIRRSTSAPSSATSTAADEVLRHVLDRKLRKREGRLPPPTRPSVFGKAIGGASTAVGGSVSRLGPGGWAVRVVVLGGVTFVLAAAAAVAVPRTDSSRHPIGGTVLYEGLPLSNGVVEFHRQGSADGEPLTVTTDGQGRFHRDGEDGLPAGLFAVVVRSGHVQSRGRIVTVEIPAKYGDVSQTPLRASVSEPNRGMKFAIHR